MLRELHISNLAVIEDARLELSEHLNCFTGQTGAGKSLVLGAFEILLGLRSGSDMIRAGAEEARVSGVFELRDPQVVDEIARVADVTLEPGEQLLITRKLFASGRSSTSINGQPATHAMVRAVGELLVDIHGQHDHQYLLKPSNQLQILDAFGKSTELRERFEALYTTLRDLRARQAELHASQTLRRQQLELYTFQAQEIDAAEPIEGEFAELQARHALLSNLERIQREAGNAYAALYESDGSVLERAQMIAHVLLDLVDRDPNLGEVAEQVRTAVLSLQEGAYELGRYLDRLEADPDEQSQVEDRLNTLNRLLAKYVGPDTLPGDDPVATLLAYRQEIQTEIDRLENQTSDLATLEKQIIATAAELEQVGTQLSAARRAAARKLTPLVESELKELGMEEATFAVSFEAAEAGETGAAAAASPTGFDRIEMVVQTNPGQPARPLRKIASGGEMSRIMLALKAILAQADRISVLVFDEIDANIGGRMGTVIGRKLRELATGTAPRGKSGAGQQVLCITHLPQIAAFADCHLRISKQVEGKGKARQTRTTVKLLTGRERIEELAEMLAGSDVTATTRKQAKELLAGVE